MKKNYWKALDTVLAGDWSSCSRTVTGTVNLITSILCFCLYSTVIGTLSPGMLAAIIALSLLSYFFNIRHIHYEESLREEKHRQTENTIMFWLPWENQTGQKIFVFLA